MARSTKISESPAPFDENIYEASPEPDRRRTTRSSNVVPSMSPSPAASVSSDKENRSSRPLDKDMSRALMNPSRVPTPTSGQSKRKRASEREVSLERNRRRRTVEVDDGSDCDLDDYDPDQDVEERRHLRKGLRDLSRTLTENRSEYLTPTSTGLRDTLIKANNFSGRVKQTSDATIDSRLLVTTADLSYKKTLALVAGDTSQGVDLEDFVSKCKQYMERGERAGQVESQPSLAPNSTQRRRRRQDYDEEDQDENGDMLNWEYLGRYACLPHNSRPSVPGFLYGPLSLEKRARKVVVRKAALRPNNLQETRPEVLRAGDIEKSENANLTTLCRQILSRLKEVREDAAAAAAAEADSEDGMTTKQEDELLDRHGISRTGGIAYFKFVINPLSFGQTVENLFYVSFLIRDGKVGVDHDERGMPYLGLSFVPYFRYLIRYLIADDRKEITQPGTRSETTSGPSKHQAVIALDMTSWEELIDLYDITESMIPHRHEEEHSSVGTKGWYA